MLKFLSVRDFVIVSSLELDFSSGFTALTGETGAGKSILIGALSLALGERGDAAKLREGWDECLDILGRHAHQSLLRPDMQRMLLDGHAGMIKEAGNVAALYRD